MKLFEIIIIMFWVVSCCGLMWLKFKPRRPDREPRFAQRPAPVEAPTITGTITPMGQITTGEWRTVLSGIRLDKNGIWRGPLNRPLTEQEIDQFVRQHDPNIANAVDMIYNETAPKKTPPKGKDQSKFNMMGDNE